MIVIVFLMFLVSIVVVVYKFVSRKMKKQIKIHEILMTTKDGRNFIAELQAKNDKLIRKIVPPLLVLLTIVMILCVLGAIIVIKEFYDKGLANASLEDIKILVVPGILIYFIILFYRLLKWFRQ